ncbi:MAG TPA: pitrilysin family protein [Propionibacteriaceae bacterium]
MVPTADDAAARVHPRRTSSSQILGGEVRRTVLPSGLRVVSENMAGSRTFSVGFYVNVGSRHETDALHGASHFLEHVLFKGTARRSAEDISAAIESVGGDLNAYTTKEYTCFYARVLDVDAELAVEVLTDMLTSSRVLSREVDAERAVILDEIAMHADDPGETVQELVTAAIFGDSGLGRPVIGSVDSISALTRAQIVRHWRRHYRPSSVVVSAAGNVDHDRLVERLRAFDELEVGPEPVRPAPTRVVGHGEVVTVSRPLEQCTVALALPSPGVFDDRRYPLGLLSMILGGGMSSRLFVEIRERRGLSYGIDADETAYSDAGLWSVDWQCAPDKLEEILTLVRAILSDVAEHGVTDAELRRAQGQMRGQTILSFEGPNSRMGRLGVNTLTQDERSLNELLDRFDAVTGAQVQAEARALFSQPPVLAVVGPRVSRRRLETLLDHWVTSEGEAG